MLELLNECAVDSRRRRRWWTLSEVSHDKLGWIEKRTKSVDEKVTVVDKVTPEEASTTFLTLKQEIGSSVGSPSNNWKTSTGLKGKSQLRIARLQKICTDLEDEKTENLLHGQTEDCGSGLDGTVLCADKEDETVEHDETAEGNCTPFVWRSFGSWDTECRSKEESKNCTPSDAELAYVRKHVPRLFDDCSPNGWHDANEGLLGNVAVIVQEDEEDEEPRLRR
jgi:hypothetical protein